MEALEVHEHPSFVCFVFFCCFVFFFFCFNISSVNVYNYQFNGVYLLTFCQNNRSILLFKSLLILSMYTHYLQFLLKLYTQLKLTHTFTVCSYNAISLIKCIIFCRNILWLCYKFVYICLSDITRFRVNMIQHIRVTLHFK